MDDLSSALKEIAKIRQKSTRNDDDKLKLFELQACITIFAKMADCKLFCDQIPESEIQVWMDGTIEDIKTLSSKPSWINTGVLNELDEMVLDSCIGLFHHAVPVVLAFESDFFQVLAGFVQARLGSENGRALPSERIWRSVSAIVSLAFRASITVFDNKWRPEKFLRKLETTGVLEQLLRCLTVPQEQDDVAYALDLLQCLQACPDFLSRKFKEGKPCGDTLRAILDGNDGSTRMVPEIRNELEAIAMLLHVMEPDVEYEAKKPCGYCGKSDSSEDLMQCSRCRGILYCSKDCQKAHWHDHKKCCTPTSKSERRQLDTLDNLWQNFIRQHYHKVMDRMFAVCSKTGLKPEDMAVEIDFVQRNDGVIPALQNPPIFKIAPRRDYFEMSEKPDWVCERPDPENYMNKLLADWKKSELLMNTCTFLLHYDHSPSITYCPIKEEHLISHRQLKCQQFLSNNFVEIMARMVEVCDNTGQGPEDMVLELDFGVNQDGVIPSVQDSTIFTIVQAESYVDGSRPDAPGWFSNHHRGPACREAKKKASVALVKESLKESKVAFLVNFTSGIERFKEDNGISEERVDAFRKAMYHEDYSAFTRIWGPEAKGQAVARLKALQYPRSKALTEKQLTQKGKKARRNRRNRLSQNQKRKSKR